MVVVVAGAVSAAGCVQSTVDPAARVVVRARVVDPAGAPAAGRPVAAVVEPAPSDLVFGLPLTLGTLGLACLADDVPKLCAKRRLTRTDARGEFRFELEGRDVRGMFGDARRLVVAGSGDAAGAPVGPVTSAAVVANATDIALGGLRLWGGRVDLAEAGADVTAAWPALEPALGVPGRSSVVFEQAGGAAVWEAAATATGAQVDGRVLEDSAGAAVATVESATDAGPLAVTLAYRSAGTPYRAGAGAPVSRGAACRDAPGAPLRSPCPLTDGDLTSPAGWAGTVTVELGAPRRLELVVVRGCGGRCTLEALGPSGASVAVAEVADRYAALALPGAPTASALRLSGGLGGVAEVSVWDGPGRRPLLRVGPAGGATAGGGGRGEPGVGRGGRGGPLGRTWWVLIAAVSALLAGAGGFVAGRRRRAVAQRGARAARTGVRSGARSDAGAPGG
jgi:hypothetical protein